MTEQRLDARDRRFIAVCLLVIVAGAAITAALFRRAFPEASIEFRVPRARARVLAETFLSRQGRSVAGTRFAARFGVDEEPKIYLERELGLERASKFYGKDAKVWHWDMRWFRSAEKAEERVSISHTPTPPPTPPGRGGRALLLTPSGGRRRCGRGSGSG